MSFQDMVVVKSIVWAFSWLSKQRNGALDNLCNFPIQSQIIPILIPVSPDSVSCKRRRVMMVYNDDILFNSGSKYLKITLQLSLSGDIYIH